MCVRVSVNVLILLWSLFWFCLTVLVWSCHPCLFLSGLYYVLVLVLSYCSILVLLALPQPSLKCVCVLVLSHGSGLVLSDVFTFLPVSDSQ